MSAAESPVEAPRADPSLKGKLRRRGARLFARRGLAAAPAQAGVCFTFDDIPRSAALAGAAALEARGLRGTFYVCAGLLGQVGPMGPYAEADDIRRLAAAGHEIGCHTFSHLACGPATPGEVTRDVEANAAALEALTGAPPRTFAFPFGDVSRAAKVELAPSFALLRALHPGLLARGSDLNHAPAFAVDGPQAERRGVEWIDRAAQRGAWLILCLHDIAEPPSPWGCTPATLERLIDHALERGCRVQTVAGALESLVPA